MTLALALALLCWLLLRSFSRAPIGLALVGLRDQPLRTAALGYQAWRIRLCAFMTAGAVAGAAGGLYPFANQYVSPQQVHWSFSATLIIMGVIGGIRTWRGAFIGATVYLFAQTYLSSYTDRWQLLVGLIFVATVLFMPNGLAERRRRSS
ncbi:branched-chain amino acid ABC transporter permease [Alcaligenes sp. Marseille-Q7550]